MQLLLKLIVASYSKKSTSPRHQQKTNHPLAAEASMRRLAVSREKSGHSARKSRHSEKRKGVPKFWVQPAVGIPELRQCHSG